MTAADNNMRNRNTAQITGDNGHYRSPKQVGRLRTDPKQREKLRLASRIERGFESCGESVQLVISKAK